MPILLLFWLIASLFILFRLRVLFIKYLTILSLLLTGSSTLSKFIYSLIFFPGVVIHELSHFFAAAALGVRTGEINIFPKEIEGEIKLGSVKIAKTDVLRGALIGSAPFLVGISLLFMVMYFNYPLLFSAGKISQITDIFSQPLTLTGFLMLYLLFTVSNTMALSKSDMAVFIPALLIIGLLVIFAVYFFDADISGIFLSEIILKSTAYLSLTFTAIALINLLFLLPLLILVNLLHNLRKNRVYKK